MQKSFNVICDNKILEKFLNLQYMKKVCYGAVFRPSVNFSFLGNSYIFHLI